MDMNTNDELRHLLLGVRADEAPQGFGIAGYRVSCPRDSFAVLESARETLTFILTCKLGVETASTEGSAQPDLYDVSLLLEERVTQELSAWYRQRFNLEPNDSSADCVRGFGRGRDWQWWDARIRADNDFLLLLDVSGWPCSGLTALRNLLEKCGAESMDEMPEEEW